MFRLVKNIKMIGRLFNVVHGKVQKRQQKTYKKWFSDHSTLINYGLAEIMNPISLALKVC